MPRPRVRSKTRQKKSVGASSGAIDVLHGTAPGDPNVVAPRLLATEEALGKLYKVLRMLSTLKSLRAAVPQEEDSLNALVEFITTKIGPAYKECQVAAAQMSVPIPTDEDLEGATQFFLKFKQSSLLKSIIVTFSRLKKHVDALESGDATFLGREIDYFRPLAFSDFDVRYLWVERRRSHPQTVKMVLALLVRVAKFSEVIFDNCTRVDIDKKALEGDMMRYLNELHRMLPRCNSGIARLKDALGTCCGNMDVYYRDALRTGSTDTIQQNLLNDVVEQVKQNSGDNAAVLSDLSVIVGHLRKRQQQMPANMQKQMADNSSLGQIESALGKAMSLIGGDKSQDVEVETDAVKLMQELTEQSSSNDN